ncbi:MAG: hypothetical protein AABX54_04155 [Nanoarchaeota archaeon]
MKEERHIETLKEVLDEIETALKDVRGLVSHQRRLAFSLSLGVVNLIELYFHKLSIIKEGAKINHKWLKRKKETLLEHLQQQITSPIDSVENINKIIDIAIKIEEKRDDLAYGVPSSEKIIQEKINLFFELKGVVGWKI